VVSAVNRPATPQPVPASGLAVAQALYTAVAAREEAALRRLLAPDVAWIQNEGLPGGARRRGVEEVLAGVLGALHGTWEGFEVAVEEWIDACERVVAIGEYRGRHRVSGRRLRAAFAHVLDVRAGRVERFRQYTDTAMFVAAAGAGGESAPAR